MTFHLGIVSRKKTWLNKIAWNNKMHEYQDFLQNLCKITFVHQCPKTWNANFCTIFAWFLGPFSPFWVHFWFSKKFQILSLMISLLFVRACFLIFKVYSKIWWEFNASTHRINILRDGFAIYFTLSKHYERKYYMIDMQKLSRMWVKSDQVYLTSKGFAENFLW